MLPTKVGIREFRENLASYLKSQTPVAITRHGTTIGHLHEDRNELAGGCLLQAILEDRIHVARALRDLRRQDQEAGDQTCENPRAQAPIMLSQPSPPFRTPSPLASLRETPYQATRTGPRHSAEMPVQRAISSRRWADVRMPFW